MTWLRGVVLVVLGAAIAVSIDRLVVAPTTTAEPLPPVAASEPGPGDPPVVWLDGELEALTDNELSVREGKGPLLQVERFTGGATSFLRQDGAEWVELATEEVDAIEAGQPACVEALLDGRTFLALRVFLGVGCGPVR